jgi:hypothetical protein
MTYGSCVFDNLDVTEGVPYPGTLPVIYCYEPIVKVFEAHSGFDLTTLTSVI